MSHEEINELYKQVCKLLYPNYFECVYVAFDVELVPFAVAIPTMQFYA